MDVEKMERARKEEEDLRRLAEKKKVEIEEDWRPRAESDGEGSSSKRLKVNVLWCYNHY